MSEQVVEELEPSAEPGVAYAVTAPPPAEEAAPAPPARRLPSLWRNRDYVLPGGGQDVSGVGTPLSGIAFPLPFLGLTVSPAAAGVAGAPPMSPYGLFSLPAGPLIDRWD